MTDPRDFTTGEAEAHEAGRLTAFLRRNRILLGVLAVALLLWLAWGVSR